MDDELDEMPIVEDEAAIPASSAIAEAAQAFLEEDGDNEDSGEGGSAEESSAEGNSAENTQNQSGNSVGEEQGKSQGSEQSEQTDDGGEDGGEGGDDGEDDGKGGGKDSEAKKEAKKEAKEKERKGKADKVSKQLKDESKKKIIPKITATFMNPASKIPADIQTSLNETGKTIKDTSQKTLKNNILKPEEKEKTVKEAAVETAKTGAVHTVIQTALKAIREALKKLYTTPPVAVYAWAITAGIVAYIIQFLFLVILIMAIAGTIAGAAASVEPEYMTEGYCITSENFYGIRTAYIDETILSDALEQSYKQYVIDILEDIDNTQSISITITLPDTSENKPLTNETPVGEHIETMSLGVAKIAAGKSVSDTITDFTLLYPEIDYFGLTEKEVEDVNDFITKYLTDYSIVDTGESSATIAELVDIATEKLTYINNLCEKVMICDYIAEDSGLKDVKELIYVGSIYMPNKDITITSLSTAVSTTTPEFPVTAECIAKNGENIIFSKSGTSFSDDGKLILDSIDDSIVEVSKFTNIDTDNTEAFINGVSLFEALRLGSKEGKDYSLFFQKQIIDDDTEIYTWIPASENIMYITYESTSPFIFNDLILEIADDEAA